MNKQNESAIPHKTINILLQNIQAHSHNYSSGTIGTLYITVEMTIWKHSVLKMSIWRQFVLIMTIWGEFVMEMTIWRQFALEMKICQVQYKPMHKNVRILQTYLLYIRIQFSKSQCCFHEMLGN